MGKKRANKNGAGGGTDCITAALRSLAVPIGTLRADPDNVRRHGRENLDAIAASLAAYGQQVPVVFTVAPGGKARVVRKGNGLLAAARRLGWTHLAAVESSLTGDAAKAFAIADNRTSDLSEFDPALLAAQLQDLEEADVPLEEMGFDDETLDALLAEVEEPRGVVGAAGGEGGAGNRKKGARMMGFVCGQFHFEIPRDAYETWLADLTAKVSGDPDRVVRELKRRLKLPG